MADLIRIAVLLGVGLAFGLTGAILVAYAQVNRRSKQLGLPFVGVLPRHIYMLGGSHMLLLLGGTILVIERIGDPFVFYGTPLVGVAVAMSIAGLMEMLRYQRLRLRMAKSRITSVEHEIEAHATHASPPLSNDTTKGV